MITKWTSGLITFHGKLICTLSFHLSQHTLLRPLPEKIFRIHKLPLFFYLLLFLFYCSSSHSFDLLRPMRRARILLFLRFFIPSKFVAKLVPATIRRNPYIIPNGIDSLHYIKYLFWWQQSSNSCCFENQNDQASITSQQIIFFPTNRIFIGYKLRRSRCC